MSGVAELREQVADLEADIEGLEDKLVNYRDKVENILLSAREGEGSEDIKAAWLALGKVIGIAETVLGLAPGGPV